MTPGFSLARLRRERVGALLLVSVSLLLLPIAHAKKPRHRRAAKPAAASVASFRIQLIDVSGRTMETVRATASGQARLSGNGLRAGVYWVKLSQGANSVRTRTVFIR